MIYLDLDGVMADLEGHYLDRFGHKMSEAPSRNQMWRNIEGQEDFWATIPPVKGAPDFYDWLIDKADKYHKEVVILTAAPPNEKYHSVATHKIQWVRRHLSTEQLTIPAYGSESKAMWARKPDILIDDWKENIAAWEAKGGYAVKHEGEDFESTKRRFEACAAF